MTARHSPEDNAGSRKVEPRKPDHTTPAETATASAAKQPQPQVLLALAEGAGVKVWATPEADPYMTVPVDGHREHHRLGTRASRDWLSRLYYRREGKAPNAQALQDALGVLRGEALWGDGQRHPVEVRHATRGETVYVDIGDPSWRAVEVDAAGWRIVADPPVRFRRPRGLLPLPDPERGGSLDVLRPLLNVGEEAWTLIAGWLIGALRKSLATVPRCTAPRSACWSAGSASLGPIPWSGSRAASALHSMISSPGSSGRRATRR
jgi:hypothetical protein